MAEIAIRAGDFVRENAKRFGNVTETQKGVRDFQTEIDVASERMIVESLRKLKPEAGIWGEEGVGNFEGQDERFIIDPIDGTTNFAWGIPHYGIVISYEMDGKITDGVVYDPNLRELFEASAGQGAYLNGERLNAYENDDPINAVFGAGLPVPGQVKSVKVETYNNALLRLMDTSSGVRRLGSSALSVAYVAAGRLDGFFEDGLSHIDIGASVLIAREAGCIVSDFAGNENLSEPSAILAATPKLHGWLLESFKE